MAFDADLCAGVASFRRVRMRLVRTRAIRQIVPAQPGHVPLLPGRRRLS